MSQFDLYENLDRHTQQAYPYFVDIQNDLLDSLNSRLVIPLAPVSKSARKYPDTLCPVVRVASKTFALLTQQMAAVPVTLLKKKTGTVLDYRTEIIAAVDFLITGI